MGVLRFGFNVACTLTEGPRALAEFSLGKISKPYIQDIIDEHGLKGDGAPVITIPGFCATGLSLKPMRDFLGHNGYKPYDWGQGVNMGPVHYDQKLLVDNIKRIADDNGRPVNAVVQSLGGVVSKSIAAALQESGDIGRVIMLGSPVNEKVLDTEAKGVNKLVQLGFSLANPSDNPKVVDFMSAVEDTFEQGLKGVPITAIYSHCDGVIRAKMAKTSLNGQRKENVRVFGASHLGMGFHPIVRLIIADRLAQSDGVSKQFDPSAYPLLVRSFLPQRNTPFVHRDMAPA